MVGDKTVSGFVVAPAMLRLAAYLLDAAILVVVMLAFTGFGVKPDDAAGLVFLMLLAAAYHIGFTAAAGATLGKRMMHIYVAYPDGTRPRPDTAILRYVALIIGNLIVVGTFLSLGLIFFDKRRRAVHDRVAGTLVLVGTPEDPGH